MLKTIKPKSVQHDGFFSIITPVSEASGSFLCDATIFLFRSEWPRPQSFNIMLQNKAVNRTTRSGFTEGKMVFLRQNQNKSKLTFCHLKYKSWFIFFRLSFFEPYMFLLDPFFPNLFCYFAEFIFWGFFMYKLI